MADHFAGTVAAWNHTENLVSVSPKSNKFVTMLEDVIADSPTAVILGLEIGEEGLQARRVQVIRADNEPKTTEPSSSDQCS